MIMMTFLRHTHFQLALNSPLGTNICLLIGLKQMHSTQELSMTIVDNLAIVHLADSSLVVWMYSLSNKERLSQ